MTPKKEKLIAEKDSNIEKIQWHNDHVKRLEERNAEIDTLITSITNSEYGEIISNYNLTPEQLKELLDSLNMKGIK